MLFALKKKRFTLLNFFILLKKIFNVFLNLKKNTIKYGPFLKTTKILLFTKWSDFV